MRVRFVLPVLAALAFFCLAVLPARAEVRSLAEYAGTWRYADGREGVVRVHRAVEHAISGLPFFLEPIARERVRARTMPFRILRFEVEGNHLVFHADRWGPIGSSVDGSTVSIRAQDGTPLDLIQEMTSGRLVQQFRHPDGTRRNDLALSGDAQWLWMSVTVASPRLPAECRYRLRYQRAPDTRTQHASR
jgi:hypothetical protein